MSTLSKRKQSRQGTVLPIVTICLVGLVGFIALAIDIGMMAVARSQAQNAADVAALAGARTLDGKSTNNNSAAAVTMSETAATNNSILNTNITAAQVTTKQVGIYRYDTTAQRFQAVFGQAPGTNEAYGVMQVTISTQQPTYFARIFGVQSLNIGATATAVHRPRDVSVVLDFSGSMGYSSFVNWPASGNKSGSLNPDPRFPRFGPWSIYDGSGMVMDPANPGAQPGNLNTYAPPTPMQRVWSYADSNYMYAPNNITSDTAAGNAIVGQFLLSDNSTSAFVNGVTPTSDTFSNQNATGFLGDKFPLRSGQTASGTTAPTASQYAHTVWRLYNTSASGATNTTFHAAFEANGYDWDFTTNALKPIANRFQGYTIGPGHYGKTFYMWPPDPRATMDWRQKFFNTNDSSTLWNTAAPIGRWKVQNPGTSRNYVINYDAVLNWIKNTGPQTCPPSLRCGRVVYYDSIPTTIPIDSTTGVATSAATNDQRFWKDYIDFVLGAGRYTDSEQLCGAASANSNTGGGSTVYYNQTAAALSPQITARATLVSAATANTITGATKTTPIVITSQNVHGLVSGNQVTIAGVGGNTNANGNWTITVTSTTQFSLNGSVGNANYTSGGTWKVVPYMHYGDSPVHPRGHFWFGPLSMVAYMQTASESNGNWVPGNCYEAQCWQLKAGINAALNDIKNNHPNDLAALIFFSSSTGYNTARVSMSKNYTRMQNCLFYPYTLLDTLGNVSSTMRPYALTAPSTSNPSGLNDNSDTIIPNAGTSTCPQMGLMVAYNQFSTATDSATSTTFTGRKTASKVVIFETDGIPNHTSAGSLTSSGGYHYTGMTSVTSQGESTVLHVAAKDNARAVVKQICALDTATPPGFSTSRNPARVHAIAFGDLFETYSTSTMKGPALRFLAAVQIDGNTSPTPSGTWDTDSLDYNANFLTPEPYKLIIGSSSTRIEMMRQALERIMQGGVQVALIQ